MNSTFIDQGNDPGCPVAPLWEGIFDRGDEAAARLLHDHLQGCIHCRREVLQMQKRGTKTTTWGRLVWTLARDFGVGFSTLFAVDYLARCRHHDDRR